MAVRVPPAQVNDGLAGDANVTLAGSVLEKSSEVAGDAEPELSMV